MIFFQIENGPEKNYTKRSPRSDEDQIKLSQFKSNNGRYGHGAEEKSGNVVISAIWLNIFAP